MTLAAGARCDKRAVLRQSFRVPRTVHAVAQQIVSRIPVRDEAEYHPRPEEGAVARIDLLQNRHSAFRDLDALRDLVTAELAATTGSVMVLAPCRYQTDALRTALLDGGTVWHNPYRAGERCFNPLMAGVNGDSGTIGALRAWHDAARGQQDRAQCPQDAREPDQAGETADTPFGEPEARPAPHKAALTVDPAEGV